MKNFLIQRINENDDYTETPSDLPVDYIGGMTVPEFLDFLKQLGYDIKFSYDETDYFAKKDVPAKEIEGRPNLFSKYLYCRISLLIHLKDPHKNYPKIGDISISLNFNIAPNHGYNGFYNLYLPNKNAPTIVPESLINLLQDIEQELPNIENVSTWEQLDSAAYELWSKYQGPPPNQVPD